MKHKAIALLATSTLVLSVAASLPPKTYTVRAKLGEDVITRFNEEHSNGLWFEDLTAPKHYNITVEDECGVLRVWTVDEADYNAISIEDEVTEAIRER